MTADEGHVIGCPVLHDEDGECIPECGAWQQDPDLWRDGRISDEQRWERSA